MAQGGRSQNADQQVRAGGGLPDRFFSQWPPGWADLGPELGLFFQGFSLGDVEGLTGERMAELLAQATRINEHRKREAARGKQRR
ncbi:hypothetical protein AA15973_2718 [Komagataeibacter sucrofermentans DSM 15973]|nr:hypothetical protein AA15973_2718 [Komagataeibacter sucrofermentans DSM 15973]